MQDYLAHDPRPDLKTDSGLWERLLTYAAWLSSGELCRDLEAIRAIGARIVKLTDTGSYKLVPGEIPDNDWEWIVHDHLAPRKDELKRLMGFLDRGIPISSRLLGETVILAGEKSWAKGEDAVVYTPDEVLAMRGLGPDDVRRLHLAKKMFGGTVMDEKEFRESEPDEPNLEQKNDGFEHWLEQAV